MITLLCAIGLLVLAFFTYGKFIDKVFGIDPSRQTPAIKHPDGVDFVPMNTAKNYLIQFLNIAGLGPIFGPIMGALYGPVAFIWIIAGAIFAGGVHDYMSGMMSVRSNGKTMAEITGDYLGEGARYAMLIFSVVLLLFVGIVFVAGPAGLLANLTFHPNAGESVFKGTIFANKEVWIGIIFVYYFLSTIVPIDKIIGKIYPFLGAILMFMAFSILGAMLYSGINIPEITEFRNFVHPDGVSVWPGLFFTISCGALSGFHATQSPLVARTIKNESEGRKVFYGAMLTESFIAMIWASVAMAYFPNGISGLDEILSKGGPGLVVNDVSIGYLGAFGGLLAIIGVIICPITSGDTSFRAIRLSIADRWSINQKQIFNRLMIAVPIFIVAFFISRVDFKVIWQYFTFSNQLLSTTVLWTAVAYLYQHKKNFWVAGLPAIFMTGSVFGYIVTAKVFPFQASHSVATYFGYAGALIAIGILVKLALSKDKAHAPDQTPASDSNPIEESSNDIKL